MRIVELKEVDGRLCVFLDLPTNDPGMIRLIDEAEWRRTQEAHTEAITALAGAKAVLGDIANISHAINLLERLPA